jgi:hypothetical protein
MQLKDRMLRGNSRRDLSRIGGVIREKKVRREMIPPRLPCDVIFLPGYALLRRKTGVKHAYTRSPTDMKGSRFEWLRL